MQVIIAVHAFKKQFTMEINSVNEKPKRDDKVEDSITADSLLTVEPKIKTGFQSN